MRFMGKTDDLIRCFDAKISCRPAQGIWTAAIHRRFLADRRVNKRRQKRRHESPSSIEALEDPQRKRKGR
jgi:hypothetical protein